MIRSSFKGNTITEYANNNLTNSVFLEQAADREEVMAGWIKSEGDLFLNGAQPSLLDGPGADCIFKAEELYQSWTREPASHSLQEVLQLCTGWQDTPRPSDC